jgi:hypothetical protein
MLPNATKTAVILLAVAVTALAAAACASSSARKDSGLGVRVLDCVVVERGQGAPGRSSGYGSGGVYYLVFETREGSALARYRFEVTRQQWFRFQEGARVWITLNNNILQDIRPNNEP